MKRFLRVLKQEAEAILKASEQINLDEVEKAIEKLLQVKGKVIFISLGKGGYVGEKLAASFSSLGIASFYIHATELFHGDFGRIELNDLIIFISNSGKTKEIVLAAKELKKRGNTLIAITKDQDNLLSQTVDIKLNYFIDQESDHLNLAPTNSTTVMLAIGDALMVSVSEKMGYSQQDFKTNHPGGSLGEKVK